MEEGLRSARLPEVRHWRVGAGKEAPAATARTPARASEAAGSAAVAMGERGEPRGTHQVLWPCVSPCCSSWVWGQDAAGRRASVSVSPGAVALGVRDKRTSTPLLLGDQAGK